MKKFIIALLLTFPFQQLIAQEVRELREIHLLPTPESKSFKWEDGYEKLVDVKFHYFIKDSISEKNLNTVVINAMIITKSNCNNPLSFVPVELSLGESKAGMYAIVRYRSKNVYGSESESEAVYNIKDLLH